MNRIFALISLIAVSLTACSSVHAQIDFDIVVNFSGDESFLPDFNRAETIWESILPQRIDGREGDNIFGTLVIDASIRPIDGPGMIVGQAGTTRFDNDGNFVIATEAIMQFDTADIERLSGGGRFEDVILHEMGHALGFGLPGWQRNGLALSSTGSYRGLNGIREYQQEFDLDATSVPVEIGLRPGADNNHWDEGEQTVIDITSPNFGRPLSDALMTSELAANAFLSNTTGGQFQDLGFVVNFDAIRAQSVAAVPEPSSLAILAGASLLGMIRRRR